MPYNPDAPDRARRYEVASRLVAEGLSYADASDAYPSMWSADAAGERRWHRDALAVGRAPGAPRGTTARKVERVLRTCGRRRITQREVAAAAGISRHAAQDALRALGSVPIGRGNRWEWTVPMRFRVGA
jgi:hypothetical protein